MRSTVPFILVTALLLWGDPRADVHAAEAGGGALDLSTAIDIALRENPELRAAREGLGVADSERIRARFLLPANPTVEAGYVDDWAFANEGEGNRRVGISQELWIAGQRGVRQALAGQDYRRADALVADLTKAVVNRVTKVFAELLTMQEKESIARRVVELNRRLTEVGERRLRVGDVSQLDTNLFLVERNRAEADLLMLQARLAAARAELNALLGRDATVDMRVLDTVVTAQGSDAIAPARHAELEAAAFRQRSDWIAAEARVEAREQEVRLQQRERIPNPSIGFEWSRDRAIFGTDSIGGNPGGITGLDDTDNLLGIRLSLPIPVVDYKQADVARAMAERGVAVAEREQLRVGISRDVRAASERLHRVTEALQRYEEIRPTIDENLRLLQRAYELGEINAVALLTENNRLFQIALGYQDARNEFLQTRADLDRAIGTPVQGEATQ